MSGSEIHMVLSRVFHQEPWSWTCGLFLHLLETVTFCSSVLRHRPGQKCLAPFSNYLPAFLWHYCVFSVCSGLVEDYTELYLLLSFWSEQGGSWMTALPLLRSGTSVMSPDSRYQNQQITHPVWQQSSPENCSLSWSEY